eukprot:scaffold6484_cov114-Skeletonema_dohrnii-CCMP3373.AAC.7
MMIWSVCRFGGPLGAVWGHGWCLFEGVLSLLALEENKLLPSLPPEYNSPASLVFTLARAKPTLFLSLLHEQDWFAYVH